MSAKITRARPILSRQSPPLNGTVKIPGDKSMSHRALMFGALAKGETIISGLLEAGDVFSTAEALRAMGTRVSMGDDGLWRVQGTGALSEPVQILDMGNSGTSTRLFCGMVAGFPITATFTGDASLVKRPMGRVIEPLQTMGATFLARQGGRLPMSLRGSDALKAIEYTLPVASAQVKSAILLAGLNAHGTTTVIEKSPTRDHTEKMLRAFGVEVKVARLESGAEAISIAGGQVLRGCAVDVPSDPSTAAFPVVAALMVPGSDITVPGVAMNPRRTGLYATLIDMGADITFLREREQGGEKVADLRVCYNGPLKGIELPVERIPSMIDEIPILSMVAACATGDMVMRDLAELRVKESDRLKMVADGLAACGVNLEMGEDWLIIHGTGTPPEGGGMIETALDHRIAMSFLCLGMATANPVTVDDITPVTTSFPAFIDTMTALGAVLEDSDADFLDTDGLFLRQGG